MTQPKCQVGCVYRLNSRNLTYGVYTPNGTFIGIRTKFDLRFLFAELHRDNGGTAVPLEYLERVPDDIPLAESLDTIDKVTGKNVEFDRPIADGGIGWYFTETGVASDKIIPMLRENKQLFDFLLVLDTQMSHKDV